MAKYYELELPETYQEIYHVDINKKKTKILLNLATLGVVGIVFGISLLIYFIPHRSDKINFELNSRTIIFFLICFIFLFFYMFIHEFVRGVTYKILTKQKLIFGINAWGTYCGVPNIYIYRKGTILALIVPCIVFTIFFIALLIWFYFLDYLYYFGMAFFLSIHIGGNIGNLRMLYLYSFKFKDKTILTKDTGLEQFIYQKIKQN